MRTASVWIWKHADIALLVYENFLCVQSSIVLRFDPSTCDARAFYSQRAHNTLTPLVFYSFSSVICNTNSALFTFKYVVCANSVLQLYCQMNKQKNSREQYRVSMCSALITYVVCSAVYIRVALTDDSQHFVSKMPNK